MLIPQAEELFIDSVIDIEKLRKFVLSRRGADGGFSFCKPLPSSLPETFYAVYILKSIDCEIPDRKGLVDFLNGSIREEPYAIFYTLNCLKLLDEDLPDTSTFLFEKLREVLERGAQRVTHSTESGGTTATYSFHMPSVLREVYIITCSLRLLGRNVPNDVKSFVKKFRRGGGFGVSSPNLQETYYCLYTFDTVDGGDAEDLSSFIRQHECASGGFTKSPGGYPPYLEETYYSLSCLKLLGFRYAANKIHKILKYIASLQNTNGGFRRSIFGGISTLEDTYYAVASLRILTEMAEQVGR